MQNTCIYALWLSVSVLLGIHGNESLCRNNQKHGCNNAIIKQDSIVHVIDLLSELCNDNSDKVPHMLAES